MSQSVVTPHHTDRLELPRPSTPSRPKVSTPRPSATRLPPPTLFQGPTSHDNSHTLPTVPGPSRDDHSQQPRASRVPQAASFSGATYRPYQQKPSTGEQNDSERTDALWAEMQSTLADVELSALTSSHMFGASHAKALEELRVSQLGLAQAWAKSEEAEMGDAKRGFDGEEDVMGPMKESMLAIGSSPGAKKDGGKVKEKDKKDGSRKESGAESRNLEEETERDIALARKRREANDRYFKQVNAGVLDVVSKLEEVATAMRRVEKESREIWNESDSGGTINRGGDESAVDSATEDATTSSALTNSPVSVRQPG